MNLISGITTHGLLSLLCMLLIFLWKVNRAKLHSRYTMAGLNPGKSREGAEVGQEPEEYPFH